MAISWVFVSEGASLRKKEQWRVLSLRLVAVSPDLVAY